MFPRQSKLTEKCLKRKAAADYQCCESNRKSRDFHRFAPRGLIRRLIRRRCHQSPICCAGTAGKVHCLGCHPSWHTSSNEHATTPVECHWQWSCSKACRLLQLDRRHEDSNIEWWDCLGSCATRTSEGSTCECTHNTITACFQQRTSTVMANVWCVHNMALMSLSMSHCCLRLPKAFAGWSIWSQDRAQ